MTAAKYCLETDAANCEIQIIRIVADRVKLAVREDCEEAAGGAVPEANISPKESQRLQRLALRIETRDAREATLLWATSEGALVVVIANVGTRATGADAVWQLALVVAGGALI